MGARSTISSFAFLGAWALGCAAADLDPIDSEDASIPVEDMPSEDVSRAVLALLNDPEVGEDELDLDAELNAQAAYYLIRHRDGADRVPGTADDDLFESLTEVDRVKYVGPVALQRLSDYALAQGYDAPEGAETSTL